MNAAFRAQTIQSSPFRPVGGARMHAAHTRVGSASFSVKPRGGRSSLHTLKDLRAITGTPTIH